LRDSTRSAKRRSCSKVAIRVWTPRQIMGSRRSTPPSCLRKQTTGGGGANSVAVFDFDFPITATKRRFWKLTYQA
jgi:hypothetical protein